MNKYETLWLVSLSYSWIVKIDGWCGGSELRKKVIGLLPHKHINQLIQLKRRKEIKVKLIDSLNVMEWRGLRQQITHPINIHEMISWLKEEKTIPSINESTKRRRDELLLLIHECCGLWLGAQPSAAQPFRSIDSINQFHSSLFAFSFITKKTAAAIKEIDWKISDWWRVCLAWWGQHS